MSRWLGDGELRGGDGVAQQQFVIGPQEGDRLDLGPGVGIAFKLEADQTGRAFSVVEHPVEPRALVWPHVARAERRVLLCPRGRDRCPDWRAGVHHGTGLLRAEAAWDPTHLLEPDRPARSPALRSSRQRASRHSSASWARCWQAQVSRTSPRWLRSRNATASEARGGWIPDLVQRYGLNPPM